MSREQPRKPRRGPTPKLSSKRELLQVRVPPALYDELQAWADADDATLASELRGALYFWRMMANDPSLLRTVLKDPNASRTKLIRQLEEAQGSFDLGAVEG